jgi:hypothetical protein
MRFKNSKIVVLCTHAGVSLNYGILLNQLGYFNISLCRSMSDAIKATNYKSGADIFLLDDFKTDHTHKREVKNLCDSGLVSNLILVGDFIFDDHNHTFGWARTFGIPLLAMIRHPICPKILRMHLEVGYNENTSELLG